MFTRARRWPLVIQSSEFTLRSPTLLRFKIRLVLSRAVPLLRRMHASFSPGPGFSLMEVHAVFVADRVTTGQVFLRLLRFYPVFITPEMLDCHSSICYLPHLILAVGNSVKCHF